jgi:hypothetical protein
MMRTPVAVTVLPDLGRWVALLLVSTCAGSALTMTAPGPTPSTRTAAIAQPGRFASAAGFWAAWAEAASH